MRGPCAIAVMLVLASCLPLGSHTYGCGSSGGGGATDMARVGNPCSQSTDCAAGGTCIANRCCEQRNTCGANCCNADVPCCVVAVTDGGQVSSTCQAPNCGSTCCPSGNCCDGTCCDFGSVCVAGECKKTCTAGRDCAAGECCILQQDGSRLCEASAAACACASNNDCPQPSCCVTPDGGTNGTCSNSSAECACASAADCPTGCCAPATNANGDPVGPYVCKPGQGGAYDCCLNGHVCNDPYCCLQDGSGNEFCAKTCNNNGDCGASQCVTYSTIPFTTTCNGFGLGLTQTGCGP